MSDLFKINITYSQSHLIMPRIILGVLMILAVVIFIQEYLKARKAKKPFMNIKQWRFFAKDYDKVKLFGSIGLLFAYIVLLNLIGFIAGSIIIASLFNILYAEKKDKKSIAICIGISIIETMVLWFIFGYIFEITLP
ncbi:MAG: hypothetical protein A2Y23_01375 [Clostridiales bacterium GWB2_37_7]|nr:MAG: hypothetical protein A2Y23_01375 [Clostridiales bacterium GWB2_37_7]